MTPERNIQIEPLCKFGPGGDYVAAWPPEPSDVFEISSRLVRLLSSAAEVVAVIFGFKRAAKGSGTFCRNGPKGALHKRYLTPLLPDERIVFDRERVINEAEISRIGDTAHAKTIAVAKNGRAFSAEPMLFPDPGGNGVRIKHKSKHRIRAYSRVAKKGSALRFAEQGSLFEGQFRSAKTA